MQLIDCDASHIESIRTILNDAIVNTTAVYDYRPRSAETMQRWFDSKRADGWPVVGVIDSANQLVGFGSFGSFRNWPGYKYTAEHSIYVDARCRRQGIGRMILLELLARAEHKQLHTLVGGIDSTNTASIRLHEQLGFERAGTVKQAGFKFGRWLDLCFYQRILATPANPIDG